MGKYVLVSLVSGVVFGALDALINGNPLAVKLLAAYKPIARTSVNIPVGVIIDIVFGFAMAAVFLLLYKCLPGHTGIVKGVGFALGLWFFRVVMSVASQWMTFEVPLSALAYTLATGLVEMMILGVLYGAVLAPSR